LIYNLLSLSKDFNGKLATALSRIPVKHINDIKALSLKSTSVLPSIELEPVHTNGKELLSLRNK
jgi:hypothetical protein